jgi:superfamily II DNA/RNA helicase
MTSPNSEPLSESVSESDSESVAEPTTETTTSFADLGVREEIVRALAEGGIEHTFAIQELTLPHSVCPCCTGS